MAVSLSEMNELDPTEMAFEKEGLTAKNVARSIRKRRNLLLKAFENKKKLSSKDVPLLSQWRAEDELVITVRGFKKPQRHSVEFEGLSGIAAEVMREIDGRDKGKLPIDQEE